MDKAFVGWLLTLGVGFPLLSIVLGELSTILKKQKHPLSHAIKKVQQYLLPPLAVLLVMRELLKIAHTENSARMAESITWVAVILSVVSIINAILTTQKPEKSFQIQVPNLFFQLFRTLVVIGIVYYLLTGIWGIDISQLTTAVGVGSIAIGLALQDTLSNLVSGFLLLVAKPFKIGDWIDFDGSGARVVDQNWWSVTLDSGFFTRNVPNATLSKASITNYGQKASWSKVSVGLSYDDPPNKVIPALNSLTDGIKEIEPGSGYAAVASYENCYINYDLWYLAVPGMDDWVGSATLLSKIYYMTKREGFTIPYPIVQQYQFRADGGYPSQIPQVKEDRLSEIIAYLRSLPYFLSANDAQIEQIARKSQFKVYGEGELITQEGKADAGIYAVYQGLVKSSVTDRFGEVQTDKELDEGEVFGEMAIYPGEVSPVTTIAQTDVELIVIPAAEIVRLIQVNPNFSSEIIQFIEERKRAIYLAKGISEQDSMVNSNGYQPITTISQ